jgi:hypothetical protein
VSCAENAGKAAAADRECLYLVRRELIDRNRNQGMKKLESITVIARNAGLLAVFVVLY